MRTKLVRIHLYIAAFFSPMLIVMATSGGLYLLGVKGKVTTTPVEITSSVPVDLTTGDLKTQVAALLEANDISHAFEYIKESGPVLTTRPTSSTWYEVDLSSGQPVVTRNEPDFVKRIVELHKGHGPTLFKQLQKVMAAGLLIVLLSGLWLGLSSPALRIHAAAIASFGLITFLVIVFA